MIQKVHQAYAKALADKAWTKKMADLGIQLLPESQYAPEAFGRHTASEVDKWRKVAAEGSITVD